MKKIVELYDESDKQEDVSIAKKKAVGGREIMGPFWTQRKYESGSKQRANYPKKCGGKTANEHTQFRLAHVVCFPKGRSIVVVSGVLALVTVFCADAPLVQPRN